MKDNRASMIVGAALVILGALFLLQSFGVVGSLSTFFWAILFGLGGLVFLFVFLNNREHWWALIPGMVLVGIGVLIAFGDILGVWGGAFFLGMIGLSFLLIYAQNRELWWAIIPGGALATLAVVAAASETLGGEASGAILFLGLGATFGLLSLINTPQGRLRWALIPAGVLAFMGVMMSLTLGGVLNYVWAVALIGLGAFLVIRTLSART